MYTPMRDRTSSPYLGSVVLNSLNLQPTTQERLYSECFSLEYQTYQRNGDSCYLIQNPIVAPSLNEILEQLYEYKYFNSFTVIAGRSEFADRSDIKKTMNPSQPLETMRKSMLSFVKEHDLLRLRFVAKFADTRDLGRVERDRAIMDLRKIGKKYYSIYLRVPDQQSNIFDLSNLELRYASHHAVIPQELILQ